jgi:hypothetical protein
VLACVLLPLGWTRTADSFPLSNYPMFARDRRSARVHAIYAVAVDPDGERRWVAPELVANREVLQARAVLERAAMGRERALDGLCRSIAGRVAGRGGALAGASEVRIVRGSHDALAYFDRGQLGREKLLASCPVARGP